MVTGGHGGARQLSPWFPPSREPSVGVPPGPSGRSAPWRPTRPRGPRWSPVSGWRPARRQAKVLGSELTGALRCQDLIGNRSEVGECGWRDRLTADITSRGFSRPLHRDRKRLRLGRLGDMLLYSALSLIRTGAFRTRLRLSRLDLLPLYLRPENGTCSSKSNRLHRSEDVDDPIPVRVTANAKCPRHEASEADENEEAHPERWTLECERGATSRDVASSCPILWICCHRLISTTFPTSRELELDRDSTQRADTHRKGK